ncbi:MULTISPECIES: ABC transporter substrate-binding protein [unclassified Mesorhizobium]|uniref:ABC transporter substrate-binding protein n=1 Tax=unclassified Mesorhizobium TaxID=325217 RepID=UPI00112EAB9C|nr:MULTISPECIES: ABC transporter substrate-binding protein [unclassified Mesorhizobium]TPK95334.1 ABC transporter substrate-binding protein [Mesorhizobium sp. B2-4-16]TPL61028.1 ABC transporter substrate-binding protein [Mesorhizobium sp. B2-4-3]
MRTTFRIATLSALAAVLIVPSAAFAQDTLYVGGAGGSLQAAYEQKIFPAFEAKTGAKVVYVPGSSNDTVAKVIAQKGHEDLSLMMLDSGPMTRAVAQDLCLPLPASAVFNDIYPDAHMAGGTAVGYGYYATGLAYNTAVFAKNGWAPPTSWKDLGDPKFKGRVVIGPISGYGVEVLVMVARALGGSEKDIEPGFQFMSKNVAPNVMAWEGSQANVAQMLQSGDGALVGWSNIRTLGVEDQGAPVKFVFPKEGARQGLNTACVVNGAPQPDLANKLLEDILSPESQAILAEFAGFGPTNSKVKLDPKVAAKVVYGPGQVKSLVPVDWNVINADLPEWTKRWNREVEQH